MFLSGVLCIHRVGSSPRLGLFILYDWCTLYTAESRKQSAPRDVFMSGVLCCVHTVEAVRASGYFWVVYCVHTVVRSSPRLGMFLSGVYTVGSSPRLGMFLLSGYCTVHTTVQYFFKIQKWLPRVLLCVFCLLWGVAQPRCASLPLKWWHIFKPL